MSFSPSRGVLGSPPLLLRGVFSRPTRSSITPQGWIDGSMGCTRLCYRPFGGNLRLEVVFGHEGRGCLLKRDGNRKRWLNGRAADQNNCRFIRLVLPSRRCSRVEAAIGLRCKLCQHFKANLAKNHDVFVDRILGRVFNHFMATTRRRNAYKVAAAGAA
jgi:hypothetical protein